MAGAGYFEIFVWLFGAAGWGAWGLRALRLESPRARIGVGEGALWGAVGLQALAAFGHLAFAFPRGLASGILALGLALFLRGFYLGFLRVRIGVLIVPWVVARFALGETLGSDAGLYHAATIGGHFTSALPWGWANASPWFGYNSFWFSLVAATTPRFGAVLASAAWLALVERFRAGRGASSARTLCALALALAPFLFAGAGQLGATLPCRLFSLFALIAWAERRERQPLRNFWRFAILAGSAVAAKLIALPLAFGLLAWPRRGRFVALPRPAIFVACLGLLWTARGLRISGCVAYPLAATCYSGFSWSPSPERVAQVARAVQATNGGFALLAREWGVAGGLGRIVAKHLHHPFFPKLLGVALIWFGLTRLRSPVSRRARSRRGTGMMAALAFGFWLVSAAEFSFGLAWFIALGASLVATGRRVSPLIARIWVGVAFVYLAKCTWRPPADRALAWVAQTPRQGLVIDEMFDGAPRYRFSAPGQDAAIPLGFPQTTKMAGECTLAQRVEKCR